MRLENGIIKSEKVEGVMKKVDRGNYVSRNPYFDSPQSIGFGVTISAPHMVRTAHSLRECRLYRINFYLLFHRLKHAYALELLKDHLVHDEKALDVGSGSGYLTACMALMMEPEGHVIGIDHIPELVDRSIKNIQKDNPDLLTSGRVKLYGMCTPDFCFIESCICQRSEDNAFSLCNILVGDGRKGYEPDAPYNAIHVGATAPDLPEEVCQSCSLHFISNSNTDGQKLDDVLFYENCFLLGWSNY